MSTTSSRTGAAALEDRADPGKRPLVGELEVGLAGTETGDDARQIDRVAGDDRVGIAPVLLEFPFFRGPGKEARWPAASFERARGPARARGRTMQPISFHRSLRTLDDFAAFHHEAGRCATAETSRVGSPSTATRSASRPGFTSPRSVRSEDACVARRRGDQHLRRQAFRRELHRLHLEPVVAVGVDADIAAPCRSARPPSSRGLERAAVLLHAFGGGLVAVPMLEVARIGFGGARSWGRARRRGRASS